MDSVTQFRAAALQNLIHLGVTDPAEMLHVVKRAADLAEAEVREKAGGFGEALKSLGTAGLATAAFAPPVIGAIGGTLAGHAMNTTDDETPEDVKLDELTAAYQSNAADLRRQLVRRLAAEQASPSGRRRVTPPIGGY